MSKIYENEELAIAEFKNVITTYILPIFGAIGDLSLCHTPKKNNDYIEISNVGDRCYAEFYPQRSRQSKVESPFHFKIEIYDEALKKAATKILAELLNLTMYSCVPPYKIKRYYGKSGVLMKSYLKNNLDYAFEIGMCLFLTADPAAANTLHSIIEKMVEWSMRTYEGKNVPFGIVIDFGDAGKDKRSADYIHFLDNNSSAVLTDGMFTGILLDKHGRINTFIPNQSAHVHLITGDAKKSRGQNEIFVPYQYYELGKVCTQERVGIIALANGEIILIKNQAIAFAKRGHKWVFFDYSIIKKKLRNVFLKASTDEKLIEKRVNAIYCSLLDVSFSHTGGCLALVNPDAETKIDMVVKERMDIWSKTKEDSEIKSETIEKINILRHLLRLQNDVCSCQENDEFSIRSFFDVDRELRKEILSLDGATVVSLNGDFFCAGSIVKVDGGSSGGGRTAAAKNLARFGIGIKISEDGYIEAYTKPKSCMDSFCEKDEVEMLFKFKSD